MGANKVEPPPGFVIDSDLPPGFVLDEPKRAAPKKQDDEQGVLSRAFAGATEPLLHLATGAVATPIAGLSGLVSGMDADVVRKVQDLLTYEPKTRGGRAATDVITYPLQKVGEAADWAGGKTAEVTGSPALGAGVNTALQMIVPTLAAKGAGKLSGTPAVKPVVKAIEKTVDATTYVPRKLADVVNNMTGPMREAWRTKQGNKFVREQLGEEAIQPSIEAIRNPNEIIPGSPMTVADRIAGANMESVQAQSGKTFGSPLVAIEEALSRQTGGISDIAKTIDRRQQLGRQWTVDEIAKDASAYADAIKARKEATAPMRELALDTVNKANQIPKMKSDLSALDEAAAAKVADVRRFERAGAKADDYSQAGRNTMDGTMNIRGQVMGRTAEKASQYAADKSVNLGQQRQFLEGEITAIEGARLKPLETAPIVKQIEAKINEPGLSTVARKSLKDVADDFSAWTKGGVIDGYEAYRIRKEIGNKVELHSAESKSWDKKQAGGVERSLQKIIDDAIDNANGDRSWSVGYIKKYGEMSGALNQMEVGQTLKEGLTGSTGKERQLAFNNAVEKAKSQTNPKSGKPAWDDLTPDQQAAIDRVSKEITRGVMKDELGSAVNVENLFNIADKGKGTVSIPAMLSRPATITNWIMKKIGHGADELIAQDMGRLMKENPEQFAAKYLAETPKPNPLIDAIMKRKLAAAGMVAGAQQGEQR